MSGRVSVTPVSDSPTMEEEIPLQSVLVPAQNSEQNTCSGQIKHYRRLAVCSIICGISCLGILALISSVKAQERRQTDVESAQKFSRQARKYSVIAILVWVGILVLTPVLMALISYLLRIAE